MHPAVTESGRFIGYYSIEEAERLFAGHMCIDLPQILVEDEVAADMTVENGWRYIRNTDGTYSLWDGESFEREFGVELDSTIRRREDIRWARKRQLQSRFQRLVTGSESPTWNDVERETVRERPSQMRNEQSRGTSSTSTLGDPSKQPSLKRSRRRQLSESELKALEKRERASEELRAEMERERQEILARRREQKAKKTGDSQQETVRAQRTGTARKEPRQEKRPAPMNGQWREVNSQGAMQEARKRELKQKEKQRAQREKRIRQLHPEATPQSPTVSSPAVDGPVPFVKKESRKDARLRDEELLAHVTERHEEGACAQVAELLKRKTMEGVVLRVMTVAGLQPGLTLPRGFSPDADPARLRNFYCQSNFIRTFCFDFLAGLIERAGDMGATYGTEPLTWALDHCEDTAGPKRHAARCILAESEHTLVFSESCIDEAAACEDPLTYIPYKTTLVRIPGHEGESWGVAALQDGDEIILVTIGSRGLTDIARNMLAYVENLCRPRPHDDGTTDYRSLPQRNGAPHGQSTKSSDRVHRVASGTVSGTAAPSTRLHRGESISAPYTRRAHTRRQHYGAGNRLVKIVTIRETLVTGRCKDPGKLPKGMRVHYVS
ncbi:hypothetical protein [Collinsella ihumii]|uniref:hypothetical protein n=1 Tax=Collinsella ihumii TaxID=1720204 RepID=UPI0008329B0A|nr:hypothetical protein [Collinsella ihumii]